MKARFTKAEGGADEIDSANVVEESSMRFQKAIPLASPAAWRPRIRGFF